MKYLSFKTSIHTFLVLLNIADIKEQQRLAAFTKFAFKVQNKLI